MLNLNHRQTGGVPASCIGECFYKFCINKVIGIYFNFNADSALPLSVFIKSLNISRLSILELDVKQFSFCWCFKFCPGGGHTVDN